MMLLPRFRSTLTLTLIALQVWQPFLNAALAAGVQPVTPGVNTDQAANGVPLVNIATPNGAGVSHNQYAEFNVDSRGLILNNSLQPVNTQLGGYVLGNGNLGGGPARLILNEVTSAGASTLGGYLEVAGQKADVVVANPYGISCNGCGFINTAQATLTTGRPLWAQDRSLSGFRVEGGTVSIDGAGLNANNVDGLALYARVLQLNAALYAGPLQVVTGRNDVSLSGDATPLPADGSSVAYAIDSSALGGMYANTIRLVGTEAGVGMRLAGPVAALTGDLTLSANGDVQIARSSAAQNLTLRTPGLVQVTDAMTVGHQALMEAGRGFRVADGVHLSAVNLSATSTQGGLEVGRDAAFDASGLLWIDVAQTLHAGSNAQLGGSSLLLRSADLRTDGGSVIAATGPLLVQAAQQHYAGRLSSGGDAVLQGDTLTVDNGSSMGVQGTLQAQFSGAATLGDDVTLDASSLQLQLGSLTTGLRDHLVGHDNTVLTLSQTATLGDGTVLAGGQLTVSAPQLTTGNDVQLLASNGDLSLSADTMRLGDRNDVETAGSVSLQGMSAQVSGTLQSGGQLQMHAQQNVISSLDNVSLGVQSDVQAGNSVLFGFPYSSSFSAAAGTRLIAGQQLGIQASNVFAGDGNTWSALNGMLLLGRFSPSLTDSFRVGQGAILQGTDTAIFANQISIGDSSAVTGANSLAIYTFPGTTTLGANSQLLSDGDITLNVGDLQAGIGSQIQSRAGNLGITATSAVLGTGTQWSGNAVSINAGSRFTTASDSTIAASGALTLAADTQNHQGTLQSGTGLFTVTGQQITNSRTAHWQAGNGLVLSATTLTNPGLIENAAGDVQLQLAGTLDNSGGTIRQAGHALIAQADTVINNGGQLLSQGTLQITQSGSAALANQNGLLQGNGGVSVDTRGLDNSSGQVTSNGDITLHLHQARLVNTAGMISAGGHLQIADAGGLDNGNGSLLSAGDLSLALPDFDRAREGGTLAAGGTLTISTPGDQIIDSDFGNAGALNLLAGGALDIRARLVGGGNVSLQGAAVHIDTTGFVATPGALAVQAGTLANLGVLYGSQRVTLHVQDTLDNGSATASPIQEAQILSDGDITITRADGGALNQLNNYASRIETSNGNVVLSATTITNQSRQDSLSKSSTTETLPDVYSDNCPDPACVYYDGSPVTNPSGYTRLFYHVPARGTRFLIGSGAVKVQPNGDLVDSSGNIVGYPVGMESTHAGVQTNSFEYLVVCCASTFGTDSLPALGDEFFHGHDLGGNDGSPIFQDILFSYTYNTVTHNNLTVSNRHVASIVANGSAAAGNGNINLQAGTLNNEQGYVLASGDLAITAQQINNTAIVLHDTNHATIEIRYKSNCGDGCASNYSGPYYEDSTLPSRPDQILPAILQGGTVHLNAGVVLNGEVTCTTGDANASPNCKAASGYTSTSLSPVRAPAATPVANAATVSAQVPVRLPGITWPTVPGLSGGGVSGLPPALPQNQIYPAGPLYRIDTFPAHPYLIETDPAINTYSGFLGSGYLIQRLDWAPDITQKRLGDSYYELQVIRDSLTAATGSRFVDPSIRDERAQYEWLMNNAVNAAGTLHLVPGVALTPEQIASLQQDIVWLEQKEVAGQSVLVPVVYLAPTHPQILADGSVIGGNQVSVKAGYVANTGRINARDNLAVVTTGNIDNLGGTLKSGGDARLVSLQGDINNLSGQISGNNVVLGAAGNITNETWSQQDKTSTDTSSSWNTQLGQKAAITANGTLNVQAGGNFNNNGADLSGKDITVQATDIKIGTVTATQGGTSQGNGWQGGMSQTQNLTSSVNASGHLTLDATRDLTATGADITAGGNAALTAGGQVNLLAAQNTDHLESHLSGGRSSSNDAIDNSHSIGNRLKAGGQLSVSGDQGVMSEGTSFTGNSVDIDSANGGIQMLATYDTHNESHDSKGKAYLSKSQEQSTEFTATANVNTIKAGAGGVTITSKGDQIQQATDIRSGGGVTITSEEGRVMLQVVKNIRQSSYASSGDNGFVIRAETGSDYDETVRSMHIESVATPIIQAAQGIQVQLKDGDAASPENIDAAIDALSTQPGMSWLATLRDQGGIDYERIREVHESQHDETRSLGMVSAVIIAIAVTVATGGAGGTVMGAVSNSLTISATMAAGNSLLNGDGVGGAWDRFATRGTLVSAAVASVAPAVGNQFFDIENVNQAYQVFNMAQLSDVGRYLVYNLATNTASGLVNAALTDGDYGNAVRTSAMASVASTAGAVGFNRVANLSSTLGPGFAEGSLGRALMHAVVGAGVGQLADHDALGGAAGAFAASLMAPTLGSLSNNSTTLISLAGGVGALAGVLATGDPNSVRAGQLTGQLQMQFNYLSHQDIDTLATRLRNCNGNPDCEAAARAWAEQRDKQNSAAMAACKTDECKLAHLIALEGGNLALKDPDNAYLSLLPGMRDEIATMNAGDAVGANQSMKDVATVAAFAQAQCGGAWSTACLAQWNADQSRQASNANTLVTSIFAPGAAAGAGAGAIALRTCMTSPLCINELALGVMDVTAGEATGGASLAGGAGAAAKVTRGLSAEEQAAAKTNQAIENALANTANKAAVSQADLDVLAANGVKFTQKNVVATGTTPSGQVVFLETGNSSAGLQHIIERHGVDFTNKGITEADIRSVIMQAVTRGKIIGTNGSAPVYEVIYGGMPRYISVGVSSNGFIVRANPVSTWRPLK